MKPIYKCWKCEGKGTVRNLLKQYGTNEDFVTYEKLGNKSNLSIPFKLAFNTLLNNKIINKY